MRAVTVLAAMTPLDPLVPLPTSGRRFNMDQTVRMGDTTASGRLRLDAAARYLQDIADDDATEALGVNGAWLVRRTRVAVRHPAVLRERLSMTTFCSGLGGRWAERRTVLRGDRRAHLEAESLWVHVDIETGRPTRLPPEFEQRYGEAAEGRTVSARLRHAAAPAAASATFAFPLRAVDLDVMGHVNNAVGFAVVEEVLRANQSLRWPLVAEIEYREPIAPSDTPAVVVVAVPDGVDLWAIVARDGQPAPAFSAQVRRGQPGELAPGSPLATNNVDR